MTNLKNSYGQTEYLGRQYTLTGDAEISHSTKIQIDDTIWYLEGLIYEAPCIDEQGNVCVAYWVGIENVKMPEDICNWDTADYVEQVTFKK